MRARRRHAAVAVAVRDAAPKKVNALSTPRGLIRSRTSILEGLALFRQTIGSGWMSLPRSALQRSRVSSIGTIGPTPTAQRHVLTRAALP